MDRISLLGLAMASFVGSHLLLSHPLRAPLVRALGERAFLALYLIVSLVTLGAAIWLARSIPAQPPLWIASTGAWHGATLIMLFVAILFAGSLFGNPAMLDPTGTPKFPSEARGVYAITRHPMMWSLILWALVHLTLWGSPITIIMTLGIGSLALLGSLGQDRKKAALLGEQWRTWQRRTSFVPFMALLTGRARWRAAFPGLAPVGLGTAIWLAATWLHPLFGGPVAGPWMWAG